MKKGLLKQLLMLTFCAGFVFSAVETTKGNATVVTAGINAVLGAYMDETLQHSIKDDDEPLIPPVSSEVSTEKGTEAVSSEKATEKATEKDGSKKKKKKNTESAETATEGVTEQGTESASEAPAETEGAVEADDPVSAAAGEVTAETEPVEKICGYTNIGIADIEGNLNIRETPSEDGALCGKLPAEAACEILGEAGEWYHISSGKVEGYVKAEYLTTGDAAAARAEELKATVCIVTADVLNVREEPNTESEIVDQIATGEEVSLVEDMGEWLKVDVDGEDRYVKAEFVEVADVLKDALTMTEAQYGEGVSDVRVAVINYATQFVGNRYVWGGTSLTNGCDCSGFVLSVMAKFGIYLPHYSGSQAQCGTRISCDELKPGDLVFYGGRRISHVAIYMGNGQIVHAANKRVGITISNVYYRTPKCCTRVLNG